MHITMPTAGPYAAVAALLASPLPIPPDSHPRAALAAEIERLIAILDILDGDPDIEPQCEDEGAQCDDEGVETDGEGSLGAPEGAVYWPPCDGSDREQEVRVAPRHRPARLTAGGRRLRENAEAQRVAKLIEVRP